MKDIFSDYSSKDSAWHGSDAISPKVADVLEKVMSAESGLVNHEESNQHYTAHNQAPAYSNHPHDKEKAQASLPLLSNIYQNNYCPYPDTSYSRRDSEQADSTSPQYSGQLSAVDKFNYRREDTDGLSTESSSYKREEEHAYKREEERNRHPSGNPPPTDKFHPEVESQTQPSYCGNAPSKEHVEVNREAPFPRKEEALQPLADRQSFTREEDSESMLNGSFSREQDDSNPNPQLNSSFNESYHSDEDSFGEGLKSGLNESNSEHLLPEDYKNYSFNGLGSNPLSSPGFLGQRRYSLPPLPRSADPTSASHNAYTKQTGLYFCHLCSFSAKCKEEFDAHMSIHFEYSCPHCDYTSRTEGRLKRHIKDFHSSDSEGFGTAKMQRMQTGRPKVYRCKQCSFASTTKVDFWQHSRTHIKEEKLLQCPRCPFVTEYKHHLEYHLRNHFGSKPFKCNKCNYSCVNKSMLNSHMKSHTNVYQYRCADCTYATKYCHSLKLHLKKYNHKPAAVLNSDGSLPQGLEPEASGLSLLSKRGPPRGPRGPRKDKMDQFMSPLFHLPHTTMAGMPPGLNGALMSPYWPLLNQLPNGMQPPPPLIPVNNMPGQMRPPHLQTSPSDKLSKLEPGSVKCNLCSFTAETPEGLQGHVLKVHAAGENQDIFNMFGITSEALMDEQNIKAEMARRHSLSKSDGPPTPTRPQPSMLHVQTDQNGKTNKGSPNSWPLNHGGAPNQPSANSKSMPELAYPPRNGSQDQEPMEGADILKQMTLKFGGGGGAQAPRIRKESPLDLTKPKSVSPPVHSPYGGMPMPYPLHMGQMMLKRPFPEEVSSNENTTEAAVASPRKRSRKGKAYKLDTLCLKLQEKQSSSPYESESEESGSEVQPQEYVTETRTQTDDGSPNGRGESPGSMKDHEKYSSPSNVDNVSSLNGNELSNLGHKNDFDQIHENLKILNSGLKQENSPKTSDQDIEGNKETSEQQDNSNPEENVKGEMSKDEVADYLDPQKAVPSALRRGAELAWKILNDDGQGDGPPHPNGDSLMDSPPNGLPPLGPDEKPLSLPHPLSIGALAHAHAHALGKGKPFRGADSFECHYCEIAFRDCVMYTMHMGYHGYQDPYKCNMCGHCSRDKVEFFLHIARAAHS